MKAYYYFLGSLILAFLVGVCFAPMLISILKKRRAKQYIYEYVEEHKTKVGTPTMGGVVFIIAILLGSVFFFDKNSSLALILLTVSFAFGFVGFLDDYLKIRNKQNMGLRAYQKFLFQLIISIFISVLMYKNALVGSEIILPFSSKSVSIGLWIIPLNVMIFLATTNSVNLTDGLDGLASTVSLCVFITFFAIISYFLCKFADNGVSLRLVFEYNNLLVVCASAVGGLLAFLVFNSFPAKIFMGDTGSLFLGAFLACLGILTRTSLFIPIVGVMFVVSAISVIIQVVYFKRTKKRIFLIAPLHHHYQKKGVHEVKIVAVYTIITTVVGASVLLFQLL